MLDFFKDLRYYIKKDKVLTGTVTFTPPSESSGSKL